MIFLGKSEFVLLVVKHRDKIYDTKFERVIYCLADDDAHQHAQFIERLKEVCEEVQICQGLPQIEDLQLKVDDRPKLLILDDLMSEAFSSKSILQLMTKV
jgi:hypothetical protein